MMIAHDDRPPSPRFLTALLLLASGTVIGIALLFQYGGGLAPCELCLYERWPYYAAVTVAIIGLLTGSDAAMRAALGFGTLLFLAGAALSFYHVGVEHHWFQGPTACTGSAAGADSIEALKAQLLGRQPVNCDEPAWIFLGISLAGLDFLASVFLAGFCIAALRRLGRRRRGHPA
jgi:disulfide bond formation protein DsbB